MNFRRVGLNKPVTFSQQRSAEELADRSSTADLIIVTRGTSVGVEDFAPRALRQAGELLVHGIHLRPARPVGWGLVNHRSVILLPGNPLSCLCAYDLVVPLKRGRGSGASVLSASSRADGFVLVPASAATLPAKAVVSVNLYDG